jgi:GH24 family phage-related lysozyme (muramidase)
MHPAVQSQFRAFNEPFEGSIPYMYLDILGLVTVGVGNLIDPVVLATALPFRFKNKPGVAAPGTLASKDQINAEWQKLKSNTSLAKKGHLACAPVTDLELNDEAVNDLIAQRLAGNESFLKRQQSFKDFDTWPADAQMALLSMAWAMGPGGFSRFPHFSAACQRRDFKTAAAESKLNEAGNPGVIPRNRANFLLFSNAAAVIAPGSQLQLATLFYPKDLTKAAGAG